MEEQTFRAWDGFESGGPYALKHFNRFLDAVDELATEFERLAARGDEFDPREAERLRREIFAKHKANHFLRPTRWQRQNTWKRIYREHFPTYWKQNSTATVKGIASGYWVKGYTRDDLLNAGLFGLWQAWLTYDPENEEGAGFPTYATHCIENAIRDLGRKSQRKKNKPLDEGISNSLDKPLNPDEPEGDTFLDVLAAQLAADPELPMSSRPLRESLSSLSQYEQHVYDLALEGREPAEIAARLGREPRSVYDALRRVRDKR